MRYLCQFWASGDCCCCLGAGREKKLKELQKSTHRSYCGCFSYASSRREKNFHASLCHCESRCSACRRGKNRRIEGSWLKRTDAAPHNTTISIAAESRRSTHRTCATCFPDASPADRNRHEQSTHHSPFRPESTHPFLCMQRVCRIASSGSQECRISLFSDAAAVWVCEL